MHKEAQGGTERLRDAQRGTGTHGDAQRGTERQSRVKINRLGLPILYEILQNKVVVVSIEQLN